MPTPDVLISPQYRLSDFGGIPSLENKITIFEDRINGWFLDVAERVNLLDGDINEFRSTDFAVLAILAVYFEMIGQYHSGKPSKNASKTTFCAGMRLVFPRKYSSDQQEAIYKSLRCALYHNGLTRGAVVGRLYAEAFHFEDGLIWVNPTILLRDIKQHFGNYITDLRTPENTIAQSRFEMIYNANPKL